MCSVETMFLEIPQNSQENSCARVSFLIKLQALGSGKRRLRHSCFPVNYAKFSRTPFFIEHLRWGCNFIKKETLVQVFSCDFCEILNNNFLYNTSARLLLSMRMYLFWVDNEGIGTTSVDVILVSLLLILNRLTNASSWAFVDSIRFQTNSRKMCFQFLLLYHSAFRYYCEGPVDILTHLLPVLHFYKHWILSI